MLAIKKRRISLSLCLILLSVCGCTPPGPRALLKGERLIREGKYPEAIEALQVATRLMPKHAQAFNHLGLALHGNRQLPQAAVAYQKALLLDHKLAAARFNLGCLYVELNDAAAAIDQLTSYTLLQPTSLDGWLKLGDAQLRAHKIDAAEKSYKTALALRQRQAEALNGLGVIQLQRKRPQEALNYFNAALNQDQNYSPALLNVAIVNHQHLNNRQVALEKYRHYLLLQPRPAQWENVSAIANRLDLELNPPPPPSRPIQLAPASAAPPPALKLALTPVQSNPPARPTISNSPPPVSHTVAPPTVVAARTNTPSVAPTPPRVVAQTNLPATNPFVLANQQPLVFEPPKPPPPAPVSPPVLTNKPVNVEVTRLPDELVIKPPQEIAVVQPPTALVAPSPTTAPSISSTGAQRQRAESDGNSVASESRTEPSGGPTNPASLLPAKPEPKPEKRGLIARLNPFGGKPKPSTKEPTPLPLETAAPAPVVAPTTSSVLIATPIPSVPAFPRYSYLSPLRPVAGDRPAAERFFAEGIKAQQGGRLVQALAAYRKATEKDPAYFEAFYNRGLAAYNLGNWKESLTDYEHALAVKPNSVDARYNFALALQQASFPQDAADELREVLNESPAETRAHLLLGNLYAKQLNQPKLAREHYLAVLAEAPHHPKATEIRYWLTANP